MLLGSSSPEKLCVAPTVIPQHVWFIFSLYPNPDPFAPNPNTAVSVCLAYDYSHAQSLHYKASKAKHMLHDQAIKRDKH